MHSVAWPWRLVLVFLSYIVIASCLLAEAWNHWGNSCQGHDSDWSLTNSTASRTACTDVTRIGGDESSPWTHTRRDEHKIGRNICCTTSSTRGMLLFLIPLPEATKVFQFCTRFIIYQFIFQVKCRSAFTWWHDTVGQTLEYLDRFDIHCHHGEFLRQWRMTWGERSRKKAIRYICCRLAPADHNHHRHRHQHVNSHQQEEVQQSQTEQQ